MLDNYFESYSLVQTFAIFTFLLTIYDIIKILNSLNPSFGLLIYTFSVAKIDILIFLCVKLLIANIPIVSEFDDGQPHHHR